MLTRKQRDKMTEILNIEGDPPSVEEALGLIVKTLALQTVLFNEIVGELSGIERCLERIAAK